MSRVCGQPVKDLWNVIKRICWLAFGHTLEMGWDKQQPDIRYSKLTQSQYIESILHRFITEKCKPVATSMIDSFWKEAIDKTATDLIDGKLYQKLIGMSTILCTSDASEHFDCSQNFGKVSKCSDYILLAGSKMSTALPKRHHRLRHNLLSNKHGRQLLRKFRLCRRSSRPRVYFRIYRQTFKCTAHTDLIKANGGSSLNLWGRVSHHALVFVSRKFVWIKLLTDEAEWNTS